MTLTCRRLDSGEVDHELIWLGVSLGSLAVAIVWFAIGLPWPRCLFHDLTGLPCLTCGATRSTIAFFHGHFFSAWQWNPLAFATLCSLSIFDAYAFAVLISRAPRLRIAHLTASEKIFVRFAAIIVLLSNWVYLLSCPRGIF
jgi:Protein of unknown function (DUF2752)